jgi:hypothetical protein
MGLIACVLGECDAEGRGGQESAGRCAAPQ